MGQLTLSQSSLRSFMLLADVLFTPLNFRNVFAKHWNWKVASGKFANLEKTNFLVINGQMIVFLESTVPMEKVTLHQDLGL